MDNSLVFEAIAAKLREADALVILAGAGMGVDSGLPDFRSTGGYWAQLEDGGEESVFERMNPARLVAEPLALWASLAARMRDYSHTVPHEGFGILRKWIARLGLDAFVLSSNVDGQFLKAGFAPDRLRDLHGSLFWWQCSVPCGGDIWPNEQEAEAILEGLALGVLPRCKHCGAVARPNVYMFRDNTYLEARSRAQDALYQSFLLRNTGLKIVAIEIGSGPHVQSIRAKTRKLMYQHGAWALRINPQDFAIKPPHLGLPMSALDALGAIDSVLYRD